MNLYIYTKAGTLSNAVATSTADLADLVTAWDDPLDADNAYTLARIAAKVPEITLGDSQSFTVYFYDDATTLASYSGAQGHTCVVGIGLLELNGQQLFTSNVLTATTNGFSGRLDLTAPELVSRVHAALTDGFQKGRWFETKVIGSTFPLQFRHVDTNNNYETHAMFNVFVRDRVLYP